MSEATSPNENVLAELRNSTSEVTAAYLSRNNVNASDLPGLISSVYDTFAAKAGLAVSPAAGAVEEDVKSEPQTAAAIKKSITPDALISFIDGKPYKTLKRHLTSHGLDFDTYKRRYGLPNDYPSVAANYSAARSALASQMGLGQQRTKTGKSA